MVPGRVYRGKSGVELKQPHSCQRGDMISTGQDGGEWRVRRAEGAD